VKRSVFAALFVCAAALFAGTISASAKHASSPFPPQLQGKPIFVRIHAAWCLECKATQPTIDRIHQKYGDRVHYVDFDVTDGKTSAVAAAAAKRLHLSWLYEHDKALPSTVSIIDPRNGRLIARFWNNTNEQDYVDAINVAFKDLTAK
jgi:thiol-disulfide isomerase/thioredoxin